MLAFCEDAVVISEKKEMLYWLKKLTASQTSKIGDFTSIRCDKKPEEACETPPHYTWMDRLFNAPNVYLVRGKNGGRPCWQYVLVKEKVEEFKAQIATGSIDVTNFGEILYSGWGEDPPKENEVNDRFCIEA